MKTRFSVKFMRLSFRGGGGVQLVHVAIDKHFSLFLKGFEDFLTPTLSLLVPLTGQNCVIEKSLIICYDSKYSYSYVSNVCNAVVFIKYIFISVN